MKEKNIMFKYLDKKIDEWHETYFKEKNKRDLFCTLFFGSASVLISKNIEQWVMLNLVFNSWLVVINLALENENNQVEKNLNKKEIDFNELENDNDKKEKTPKKEIKNELMLGNLFKK